MYLNASHNQKEKCNHESWEIWSHEWSEQTETLVGREQTSTTVNTATRPQAEGTRVLGPERHKFCPLVTLKVSV